MSRIISHMVGDLEVISLTDGVGEFTPDLFPATDPAEIERLIASAGKTAIETNFNAFLVRGPNVTTLVDTGARDLFGPGAGFLVDALTEAVVITDQIDRVFITHMHPDHCAGAISEDGEAIFANAELTIGQVEYDYWKNRGNFEAKGDKALGAYGLAKSVFDAYADRTVPVSAEADLGQGLSVVPLFGHTPGHSGIRVSSGDDQFMIVGDIIHAMDLQLANPDVAVIYDHDSVMAAEARKSMLDQLATDQIACSGGHFLYPGIGSIERAGSGYRFVAD